MAKEEDINRGRKNRHAGGVWELKVRADLTSKNWLVSKFQDNDLNPLRMRVIIIAFLFSIDRKLLTAINAPNTFVRALVFNEGISLLQELSQAFRMDHPHTLLYNFLE